MRMLANRQAVMIMVAMTVLMMIMPGSMPAKINEAMNVQYQCMYLAKHNPQRDERRQNNEANPCGNG